MRSLLAVFVLLSAIGAGTAHAETLPERFARAVEEYQAGRFDDAARGFRDLRERFGVEAPALLINQGAADFQAGRPGAAMLAFHQARLAAPASPESAMADVNLGRVRALLNQRQGESGGYVFGAYHDAWNALFGWISPGWAEALLLLVWAGAMGAAAAWRMGWRRTISGWIASCCLVLCVPTGIATWGANHIASVRVAVCLRPAGLLPEVTSVDPTMVLPEGAEARWLEARGGFVRLRLSSGVEGWVSEAAVGVP